MSAQGPEKKKTLNTFMLKDFVEDSNGDLFMRGTFIQRVFGLDDIKDIANGFHFEYRFNGMKPNDEQLQKRVTQPLLDKKWKDENGDPIKGTRSTFHAKIPLEIHTLHVTFPFQINVATAKIEFPSVESKFRPDLLVCKHDRRGVFCIQTLSDRDETITEKFGLPAVDRFGPIKDRTFQILYGNDNTKVRCDMNRILDKIDGSKNFDFLSPHPMVRFQYDNEKQLCQTFTLSFIIVTSGFDRWVQLVFPIFIVSFLGGMNSLYDHAKKDGVDATAHFQITSALFLAAVFILPQAFDNYNRKSQSLTSQDLFILIFFVALLLSSVPKAMFGTSVPELLGVVFMAICMFFALYNTFDYIGIQRKVYKEALKQHSSGTHRFLQEKDKKDPPYSDLKTIGEFFEGGDLDTSLYKLTEGETKYSYLNWAFTTPDPKPK